MKRVDITGPSFRTHRWAIVTALACAAVFLAVMPMPLSNIDDYNPRNFGGRYWSSLARVWSGDLKVNGRFRPIYWVLEGALGATTGHRGTVLHLGRLAFLVAAAWVQFRLATRLGAGPVLAAASVLLVNWSSAGLETWIPSGPAEAFAQPLALGCMALLLSATRWPGVAGAAALGLASCLVKETYAAWTGAALLAFAFCRLARQGMRPPSRVALIGSAAQFGPAALAWTLRARQPDSYVQYVLSQSETAAGAARALLMSNSIVALVGLAGASAMLVRLARASFEQWDLRDVMVLTVVAGTGASTLLLGFAAPRYQLPLVTALGLAGLRCTVSVERRPTLLLPIAMAAGLCLGVLGGARAYFAAARNRAACQAEERFRRQLGSALTEYGGVRLLWRPEDVEQVLGALAHLKFEGIVGEVQIEPCSRTVGDIPELLQGYLAPYRKEIGRSVPLFVASSCLEAQPYRCEPAWLPRLQAGWPPFLCGLARYEAHFLRDLASGTRPARETSNGSPLH